MPISGQSAGVYVDSHQVIRPLSTLEPHRVENEAPPSPIQHHPQPDAGAAFSLMDTVVANSDIIAASFLAPNSKQDFTPSVPERQLDIPQETGESPRVSLTEKFKQNLRSLSEEKCPKQFDVFPEEVSGTVPAEGGKQLDATATVPLEESQPEGDKSEVEEILEQSFGAATDGGLSQKQAPVERQDMSFEREAASPDGTGLDAIGMSRPARALSPVATPSKPATEAKEPKRASFKNMFEYSDSFADDDIQLKSKSKGSKEDFFSDSEDSDARLNSARFVIICQSQTS